jgi:hypothetical protein
MKFPKLFCSLLLLLSYLYSSGQGNWVPKANYTGTSGGGLKTFSINDKGYFIPDAYYTSNNSPMKMFAYDVTNDSWSQKADVPHADYPQFQNAVARMNPTVFSIGGKGYIGCGTSGSMISTASFYEYNPTTNAWNQKANFAGGVRRKLAGAGLSNRGYAGMGNSGASYTSNVSDWYEFNPVTNTWTGKSILSAANGHEIDEKGCFSHNNKVYIMINKTTGSTELWEYDPAGDNWTMRFNIAVATPKFYFIVNGQAVFNIGHASGWSAFDMTTFTWKHGIVPPQSSLEGFTILGKGYVLGTANDFYEYTPLDIIPGTVAGVLCGGTQRTLSYTINGTFNSGNVFNVELSDASGSFASPTVIGSAVSTASGTISYTIPQSTPAGTGYRIRVSSTSPVLGGYDNGSNISINMPPAIPNICMMSVDHLSNYNIMYWDKTLYAGVDSFIIHREVTTNTYKRIGAVAFTDSSAYIDTARSVGPANGDPNITSYRYKLQIKDTCGNVGGLSPYHTSIYFNDLLNGSFVWNTYQIEGQASTPITYFELLRDDISNGNYIIIGAAAGTANTLNDPNYNTYKTTAKWRVYGNGLNCTYSLKNGDINSPQALVNKSKSNIRNNFLVTSLVEGHGLTITLAPNPVQDDLIIKFSDARKLQTEIEITDILGKVVLKTESVGNDKLTLPLKNLNSGVYFVKINQGSQYLVKKIIKE